jgi:indolepyruvate ferredoxin oxidoreductase beta subunit
VDAVKLLPAAGVRPICVTIAALGGQGGGVVSDWLVKVARHERHLVQATSVPGVAQRTGATIYYLEFFPMAALAPDRREPILALMPTPGDVDLVVASELLEAGRSMARGLVTTDRTTLITSTHRDYAISEKASRRDARVDSDAILRDAANQAQRLMTLDMRSIAEASGGHISAVMLGAVAGSGVLPFSRESYAAVIRSSGFDVARNTAAFEAAHAAVSRPAAAAAAALVEVQHTLPLAPLPPALAGRIATDFAVSQGALLELGVRRMLDYQDERYAQLYLDRLAAVPVALQGGTVSEELRGALSRALAQWMSFEDVIRVADLKTRMERVARVSREVNPQPGELVGIVEFVKPRADEMLGTLPARIARQLGKSARIRRWLARLSRGRQISTSTVTGFLALRCIALLRPWRRGTLRFQEEDQAIREWLALVQTVARHDEAMAIEVVNCQQLVRGYGDTRERGAIAFSAICRVARQSAGSSFAAKRIRALREAAADDDGSRLQQLLLEAEVAIAGHELRNAAA